MSEFRIISSWSLVYIASVTYACKIVAINVAMYIHSHKLLVYNVCTLTMLVNIGMSKLEVLNIGRPTKADF